MTGGDPTTPSVDWRAARQGDVRADIPRDWESFTCDFDGFTSDVFGPTEADACDFRNYLAFYASATFDPMDGPGVITDGDDARSSGYVYASDLAVSVGTDDRDLTRRMLASARVEGSPEIDGSEWETLEGVDLRVEVPVHWGLGPNARLDDYAVCAALGDRDDPPGTDSQLGARTTWFESDYSDGRWISVSAPTQAVGELVLASVETTPGSDAVGCVPNGFGDGAESDEWQQFEAQGVGFELPAGWAQRTCDGGMTPYGPTQADACDYRNSLSLYGSALFDPAYGPGIHMDTTDGMTTWAGYVYAGEFAVYVITTDRQLTSSILDSVRQ